jgi:hypothetical protein
MSYEGDFIRALALTITIETVVLFILCRLVEKNQHMGTGTIILAGVMASFATLPYLWFIFPAFIHFKILLKISSEIFAWLAESIILYGILRITYGKAVLFSLLCNGISFFIGLIIRFI